MKAVSELIEMICKNPVIRESFSEDLMMRLKAAEDRQAESASLRPFRIVFCGVFSSGKTSLINLLLDTEFKFPVGINPVTKTVTRIRYGETLSGSYTLHGREILLSPKRIGAVIRGEEKLGADHAELVIRVPAEILKDSVEFIDTPGFEDEEPDGYLEQLSRSAMYGADLAILCCSSLQMGKMTEIGLAEDLEDFCGNYCLVLSRMDCQNTERDRQDVLSRAERMIRDISGEGTSSGDHRIFPMNTSVKSEMSESFRQYLLSVIRDPHLRRRLREGSDRKLIRNCMNRTSLTADFIRMERDEELESLNELHVRELKRKRGEAMAIRSRYINQADAARQVFPAFAADRLREMIKRLYPQMQKLPKDTPERQKNPGAYMNFDFTVNEEMEVFIRDLSLDLAQFWNDKISPEGALAERLREEALREPFQAPRIVPKTLQVRRGLEKGLVTAVNVLTRSFESDDGLCFEYPLECLAPIIDAVKKEPLQRLRESWNEAIRVYGESVLSGEDTSGYEENIRAEKDIISSCALLKKHACQQLSQFS